MNTLVWTVQVVLALVFAGAGSVKLVRPREKLTRVMVWTAGTPQPVVKGIGTLELLGALGLILPALTGILPWLTPLAAVGLGLTMVGAVLTNLRSGKPGHLIVNAVLLVAAAFVAYGRFVRLPV